MLSFATSVFYHALKRSLSRQFLRDSKKTTILINAGDLSPPIQPAGNDTGEEAGAASNVNDPLPWRQFQVFEEQRKEFLSPRVFPPSSSHFAGKLKLTSRCLMDPMRRLQVFISWA
jgi:hypothetical protein